ncbi:hypothetical protein ACN469_25015 [Corallococcus terminator]
MTVMVPRSITSVGTGVYDVVFLQDGSPITVRCTVVEHHGIMAVQPKPDIFMMGAVNPREMTAAVLAFDRAVRGAGPHGE